VNRNTVRVGAIGAGWWATTNHFPLLAADPRVELVGVCSPGRGHLDRVQREFGFGHVTENYEELLDLGLDAVVVASPHHLHHEHAAATLDRGLAVLCEKPMALESAAAWDLVSRSERHHAPLLVAYGWNYKPFLATAARLMAEPGVGDIEFVSLRMASGTKDFFSTAKATVPSNFTGQLVGPDPMTWQDPHHGGGYAHGQLTHATGLLFWLTDLRARSVIARTSRPGAPVDLYDAAIVDFTNGSHGSFSGAGTLPDDDKFQIDIQIFGTEGALLIDVERERVVLRRHDGRHVDVPVEPGAGAYSCEGPVERLVQIAAGDDVPNDSPGHVAARSVELIEALHRSASSADNAAAPIDLGLGATFTGTQQSRSDH
jgi:predicted dehydrogenase